MKNFKLFNKALALIAFVGLAACGGNNDDQYGYGNLDPRYQQLATQCGVQDANIGNMPYKQTVRGEDPSGAIIDLYIYGTGNGQIGAIGSISIPDLSKFGAGLYGSHNGCISTQGMTGQMQTSGTYDEISINLVGPNVSLTPGGFTSPTIRNQFIKGGFVMTYQGRQIQLLF